MSAEALNWAKNFEVASPTQKAVLLILADYADSEWSCFPGQETIARMACTSVRTVRRIMVEWEEAGLISRQHRKAKEGRGRTSDRIYIHPPDQPDVVPPWSEPTNRTQVVDQPDISDRPTGQSLSGDIPVEPPVEPPVVVALAPTSAPPSVDAEFEAWWQEYPKGRRVKKPEARMEYRRARKKASADDLLTGVIAYARLMDAQRVEPRYIVHPSRWLKNERWDDDDLDTPPPSPFDGPEMRFG